MKKLTMICTAVLFLLSVSCKKDKKSEMGEDKGFSATTEVQAGNNKTHLDGTTVKWDENDAILVCSSTCTKGHKFIASAIDENDGRIATFNGDGGSPAGFYSGSYSAIYPYNKTPNTVVLPATQSYVANGFALGANPMAAYSAEATELPFKNICGILELRLKSTKSCSVKSIMITSENDLLCGTGTVDIAKLYGTEEEQQEALSLSEGGHSVTLNCGSGVDISSEEKVFRIVVPAGTLGSSFTVLLTDTEGNIWKRTASSTQNLIKRSRIIYLRDNNVEPYHPVVPSRVDLLAGCENCTYVIGGKVTVPSEIACEFGFVFIENDGTGTEPDIDHGTKIVVHSLTDPAISGTQAFVADITGMVEGTNYYLRAFGRTADGVKYSTILPVVGGNVPQPLPANWTNGTNPHEFTAANGAKIKFSQANMYWDGSAFGFEAHQFDCIGTWDDNHISHFFYSIYAQDAYRAEQLQDLSHIAGVLFTNNPSNEATPNPNLTVNGETGVWRALTSADWQALFNRNGGSKWGRAVIGGCTPGIVLLPDAWTLPDGCSFSPGDYSSNTYNFLQWAKMEANGAVFFPAVGRRIKNSELTELGQVGYLWSSTYKYDRPFFAYGLYIGVYTEVNPGDNWSASRGSSIRLVRSAN